MASEIEKLERTIKRLDRALYCCLFFGVLCVVSGAATLDQYGDGGDAIVTGVFLFGYSACIEACRRNRRERLGMLKLSLPTYPGMYAPPPPSYLQPHAGAGGGRPAATAPYAPAHTGVQMGTFPPSAPPAPPQPDANGQYSKIVASDDPPLFADPGKF